MSTSSTSTPITTYSQYQKKWNLIKTQIEYCLNNINQNNNMKMLSQLIKEEEELNNINYNYYLKNSKNIEDLYYKIILHPVFKF